MSSGEWVSLTGPTDGFEFNAFRVPAVGARKGGLVLIQEIFGVTQDLKRVCGDFAAKGYDVLCPSLFDRREVKVEIPHDTQDGLAKARDYAYSKPVEEIVGDVQACIDALKDDGPVYITGFCYGGFVSWLAAARCEGLAAASGYYGRTILNLPDEQPKCPIILHWGDNDPHIPMDEVEKFMQHRPEIVSHVYAAGHGFVSQRSNDHNAEATDLAMQRTLELFDANK